MRLLLFYACGVREYERVDSRRYAKGIRYGFCLFETAVVHGLYVSRIIRVRFSLCSRQGQRDTYFIPIMDYGLTNFLVCFRDREGDGYAQRAACLQGVAFRATALCFVDYDP